jgi:hypothetical protein
MPACQDDPKKIPCPPSLDATGGPLPESRIRTGTAPIHCSLWIPYFQVPHLTIGWLCRRSPNQSLTIGTVADSVQYVRVNHCRADVVVPEKLLNRLIHIRLPANRPREDGEMAVKKRSGKIDSCMGGGSVLRSLRLFRRNRNALSGFARLA